MRRPLTVFIWCLIVAGIAFPQADRGTVTGLVTDSSSSAVVGAQVSLVNTARNLSFEAVTNESGNYRFISVPIGVYVLKATSPGFQTSERRDVQVQVNQTTVIDVSLQVGAVTETVSITGSAIPLISTES